MIYQGITQLIEQFSPETFAIEKVFIFEVDIKPGDNDLGTVVIPAGAFN